MTGVAQLLAAGGESAPVQRVRNYYLTDRTASPRPRDFLTAMRRADDLCLRWTGPAGNRFVRKVDAGWECAEYDRVCGRKAVTDLDADRLREWLRERPPELVAYHEVQSAFEETGPPGDTLPASVATDGGPRPDEPVRVESYLELLGDPGLGRPDADALADALPAGPGRVVVSLPLALAEEVPLESVAGSDRVFTAEAVADRETEQARYLRQDARGCLVPKREARYYELAEGASVDSDCSESGSEAAGSL
ncbi:hypothetical protein [Halorussus lipolyticus]|uniref:hypothetical protein n=1 Tax=Halorussus lipolyticus TaxID=3034024 RepID=UPI0023E773D7|nr:hypothetical protein [Halorussus sp. DT80]